MTEVEMIQTLTDIFRDVMDDDTLQLRETTTADDIVSWDSITHVNLVISIEQAFKIKFALGELQDLKNIGDILNLIQQKMS